MTLRSYFHANADRADVVVAADRRPDSDQVIVTADDGQSVLSALGQKPDLEATIEAANTLAGALKTQTRLPSTLSSAQRYELRTFLAETLADTEFERSSDDVWRAIDPDVTRGPHTPVPTDVVEVVLEKLDRSVDALAFLDRLRG